MVLLDKEATATGKRLRHLHICGKISHDCILKMVKCPDTSRTNKKTFGRNSEGSKILRDIKS
jgi:hypothetical protein